MIRAHEVRLHLYPLQRRFGYQVDYVVHTPGENDLETGYMSDEANVAITIPRAIVFDETLIRAFEYRLSFVAANKNFTYGGIFEVGDRLVILTDRQIPNVKPKSSDHIRIDGKRYNMQKIDNLLSQAGFIFHVRATQGQTV